MSNLEALKEITNIDLLLDFKTYIRDNSSQLDSINLENLVLRSGLDLEKDVVIVSQEVEQFLANKYGIDFRIPRYRSPNNEAWRSMKDKYQFECEEVRLLVMKENDEPCNEIQIKAKDGSVKTQGLKPPMQQVIGGMLPFGSPPKPLGSPPAAVTVPLIPPAPLPPPPKFPLPAPPTIAASASGFTEPPSVA